MGKKVEELEKREWEEREKKAKANRKVMAKIAFKEWKEKKWEEDRQIRKWKRIQRQQDMIEESMEGEGRRGGEVLLAYGLNKNLGKLRPKSAKPGKKKGKKHIEFNENL